jgi:putative transcriptional regulator
MTKSEKALRARDSKRDVGMELLKAIREVKAGQYGAKYSVEATTSCQHG